MTKKFNLSAIFILLLTMVLSISCTQEDTIQNQDENALNRDFEIKSLSNRQALYTTNYKINNVSSFVDFANEKIDLEIPVPLSDYHFAKAYNISNKGQAAILVVISRNSTEAVNNLPINYLIETSVSFSELNLDANFLEKQPNLNIFVMNNSRAFANDADIIKCFKENNTSVKDISCIPTTGTRSTDGPYTAEDGSIIITGD